MAVASPDKVCANRDEGVDACELTESPSDDQNAEPSQGEQSVIWVIHLLLLLLRVVDDDVADEVCGADQHEANRQQAVQHDGACVLLLAFAYELICPARRHDGEEHAHGVAPNPERHCFILCL